MYNTTVEMLKQRGVTIQDMARLVLKMQNVYNPHLTMAECVESVKMVLQKHEVQYAVITGLTLDQMAETGTMPDPLRSIVQASSPLYGVDDVLGLTIVNVYGSIGLSNYGLLTREKPEFLRRLTNVPGSVHTFMDNIVAAIVAATCARIAHRHDSQAQDWQPPTAREAN